MEPQPTTRRDLNGEILDITPSSYILVDQNMMARPESEKREPDNIQHGGIKSKMTNFTLSSCFFSTKLKQFAVQAAEIVEPDKTLSCRKFRNFTDVTLSSCVSPVRKTFTAPADGMMESTKTPRVEIRKEMTDMTPSFFPSSATMEAANSVTEFVEGQGTSRDHLRNEKVDMMPSIYILSAQKKAVETIDLSETDEEEDEIHLPFGHKGRDLLPRKVDNLNGQRRKDMSNINKPHAGRNVACQVDSTGSVTVGRATAKPQIPGGRRTRARSLKHDSVKTVVPRSNGRPSKHDSPKHDSPKDVAPRIVGRPPKHDSCMFVELEVKCDHKSLITHMASNGIRKGRPAKHGTSMASAGRAKSSPCEQNSHVASAGRVEVGSMHDSLMTHDDEDHGNEDGLTEEITSKSGTGSKEEVTINDLILKPVRVDICRDEVMKYLNRKTRRTKDFISTAFCPKRIKGKKCFRYEPKHICKKNRGNQYTRKQCQEPVLKPVYLSPSEAKDCLSRKPGYTWSKPLDNTMKNVSLHQRLNWKRTDASTKMDKAPESAPEKNGWKRRKVVTAEESLGTGEQEKETEYADEHEASEEVDERQVYIDEDWAEECEEDEDQFVVQNIIKHFLENEQIVENNDIIDQNVVEEVAQEEVDHIVINKTVIDQTVKEEVDQIVVNEEVVEQNVVKQEIDQIVVNMEVTDQNVVNQVAKEDVDQLVVNKEVVEQNVVKQETDQIVVNKKCEDRAVSKGEQNGVRLHKWVVTFLPDEGKFVLQEADEEQIIKDVNKLVSNKPLVEQNIVKEEVDQMVVKKNESELVEGAKGEKQFLEQSVGEQFVAEKKDKRPLEDKEQNVLREESENVMVVEHEVEEVNVVKGKAERNVVHMDEDWVVVLQEEEQLTRESGDEERFVLQTDEPLLIKGEEEQIVIDEQIVVNGGTEQTLEVEEHIVVNKDVQEQNVIKKAEPILIQEEPDDCILVDQEAEEDIVVKNRVVVKDDCIVIEQDGKPLLVREEDQQNVVILIDD